MTTIAVPHPRPPPSLSVLDASTGQTVTVVLEDGGMETVGALVPKIEQELKKATGNAKLFVMKLACGTMILWRRCSSLENTSSRTLDYYLLDGEVWIVLTGCITGTGDIRPRDPQIKPPDIARTPIGRGAMRPRDPQIKPPDIARTPIGVAVKGGTGTVQTVYANASDTIAYFMEKVEYKTGVPVHAQRLVYSGKQLESSRTLSDYNINNGSVVHLIMRLPGGGPAGVEFVDINNPSGPTRQEWSTSAPEWRVARPGLCVEGVCENRGCSAYKHHVIMNEHHTRFDLIEDGPNCSCPLCRTSVVPTICAFNNCRWKWVGKKIDPHTRRAVVVGCSEWKTADDAYHRFDEGSGKVNWLRLTITTEPTTSEKFTCAVCLSEHVPECDQMALECGHKFHPSCLKNSTCPLCRARPHMTAFQRREAGLTNVR